MKTGVGCWVLGAGLALSGSSSYAPRTTHYALSQGIRRSQQAVVRQKLGETWIELRFSRPVARGRSIFGGVVPWGETWTPGADTATSIQVSTPIQVEGQALPRGTYSIWVVTDSAGPWTVIFNRRTPVWHTRYPGEGSEQLRLRVAPVQGPAMESLLWYFPTVDGADATLVVHWSTTVLPLHLHADD